MDWHNLKRRWAAKPQPNDHDAACCRVLRVQLDRVTRERDALQAVVDAARVLVAKDDDNMTGTWEIVDAIDPVREALAKLGEPKS